MRGRSSTPRAHASSSIGARSEALALGVLRVVRDEGPFSDNSYELAHDPTATADSSAGLAGNATSVERTFHLQVPEGEHRYDLGPLRGAAALLRMLKSSRFDETLASAGHHRGTAGRSTGAGSPGGNVRAFVK